MDYLLFIRAIFQMLLKYIFRENPCKFRLQQGIDSRPEDDEAGVGDVDTEQTARKVD